VSTLWTRLLANQLHEPWSAFRWTIHTHLFQLLDPLQQLRLWQGQLLQHNTSTRINPSRHLLLQRRTWWRRALWTTLTRPSSCSNPDSLCKRRTRTPRHSMSTSQLGPSDLPRTDQNSELWIPSPKMQLTVRTGRLGAAAGATGGGGDGGAGSVVSAAIRLVDRRSMSAEWAPPPDRLAAMLPWGRASSICLSAMEIGKQGRRVGGSGGLFSSKPGPVAVAGSSCSPPPMARCLCVRTSRSWHGYLSPVSTCVWYDQPLGIKLHDDHGRSNQSDCRLNMDITVLPWLAVFTDSRECSLFSSSVSLSLQVFLT